MLRISFVVRSQAYPMQTDSRQVFIPADDLAEFGASSLGFRRPCESNNAIG